MINAKIISAVITPLLISTSACSTSSTQISEIMLVDKLDDARGYCLDIAGGKGKDAPLDRELQAHTCYSYTGGILEDQGFDVSQINKGKFIISYFDVCLSVLAVESGAQITLSKCDGSPEQHFELKPGGQLSPKSDSNLCVTVDATNKREGRGGETVHVMRPISLQACEDDKKAYQTWKSHAL